MPLYDFECAACKLIEERLVRLSDLDQPQTCPAGHPMIRLLAVPSTYPVELTPYFDRALDMRIESRAQRRRVMRARGLHEAGTSHLIGARGTAYSFPGRAANPVRPSGGYVRDQ